jgi:hypothetical protein
MIAGAILGVIIVLIALGYSKLRKNGPGNVKKLPILPVGYFGFRSS